MPVRFSRLHKALGLAGLFLLSSSSHAVVRLPAILSDHMVLQRDARVPIWGWADPDEAVTVSIDGRSARTRAGKDGRWKIELDLRKGAATPLVMKVRGANNELQVSDVLLGEVWLGAGQSNMEKPLGEMRGQLPVFDAQHHIESANYPDIRLFKVKRRKSKEPQDDVEGRWVRCAPDTVDAIKFSAAAYFFGQRVHETLRVPVGLIETSWGGTRIEPWTPAASIVTAASEKPDSDGAQLFNGQVAGIAPFALKGFLWYQGESNVTDLDDIPFYARKMEALVSGWRSHFQAPQAAFYYVQLAPHTFHVIRRFKVQDADLLPRMWEAQADALRIPDSGMIVTTDLVDDLDDIHPRDKRSIGQRLAGLALAKTYGRADVAHSGPVFRELAVQGGEAVLTFDHADGLAARNGKPLDWFDVSGADGRWYGATAAVKDGKVVVSSPSVPAPVAVRFAWDEAARPNLVNGAGLPAMPFRSNRPGK